MARAKTPRNTEANSRVITMPETTSTPVRKSAPASNPTPINLEAQIRERAYEIYEQRGCTPGNENEDWFRAEREVLARQQHHQSA